MPVIPESYPFTACQLTDPNAGPLFSALLQNHLNRLILDGCHQPYLSSYLQHTAAILTMEYSRAVSVGRPACFLNESLLHHYGPEVAHQLNTRAADTSRNAILYPNRFVVMTAAPRSEILERLEARRGQHVHWDGSQPMELGCTTSLTNKTTVYIDLLQLYSGTAYRSQQ